MKVIHKNLMETIPLLLSLGTNYSGEQFSIVFSSGKYGLKTFTCSYNGTEYVNCSMADATHVLCTLDNHGLPCGLLSAKICVHFASSLLPDGTFDVGDNRLVEGIDSNNQPYHIELTNGKSDAVGTTEMVWNLLSTVLKGAKGDAGQKGADGLTTAVKVNGQTYVQVNGVVDLGTIGGGSGDGKVKDVKVDGVSVLNESTGVASITMPSVPSKTSELTNDSGFLTEHQDISGKQDKINDLDAIRSGAALGATALQSEVHTGDYSKPDGGIPKTDLASGVQASLGKADTALQSYTETDPTVPSWAKEATKPSYTASEISDGDSNVGAKLSELSQKMYEKPEGGIPATDLASSLQTSISRADAIYDDYINAQNLI